MALSPIKSAINDAKRTKIVKTGCSYQYINKIKLRYSRDYKIHSLLLDNTLVSNNKAIQLLKR